MILQERAKCAICNRAGKLNYDGYANAYYCRKHTKFVKPVNTINQGIIIIKKANLLEDAVIEMPEIEPTPLEAQPSWIEIALINLEAERAVSADMLDKWRNS